MVLLSSLVRRYQQTSTASGRDGRAPFIEIELDLLGRDVRYNPPLGFCGDGGGLSDRVLTWVDAFLSVGALFARIDGQEGDYIRDLQVCSVQHCAVAVWWSLWQCCSPSVPRLCLQDAPEVMLFKGRVCEQLSVVDGKAMAFLEAFYRFVVCTAGDCSFILTGSHLLPEFFCNPRLTRVLSRSGTATCGRTTSKPRFRCLSSLQSWICSARAMCGLRSPVPRRLIPLTASCRAFAWTSDLI